MAKGNNGNGQSKQQLEMLLDESFRLHRSDPVQAITLALQARDLAEELRDVDSLAKAHYRIGCAKRELSQFGEAVEHLNLSITASNKIGNERQLAAAYHVKGSVLSLQSEFTQAKELLQKSAAIRRELGLKIPTSDALIDLASTLFRLGDYAAALEALYECLQLLEGSNEDLRLSILLSTIGSIYIEANYDQKAEEYLSQALEIVQQLGDRSQEAILRLKLFSLDRGKQPAASAIKELNEIETLLEGGARRDLLLDVQLILAQQMLAASKAKEAVEYARSAYTLADNLGIRVKRVQSDIVLGDIARRGSVKEKKLAEKHYKAAIEEAIAIGSLVHGAEAAGKLALYYKDANNAQAAVEYLLKERELLNQFNIERQQRAVPQLQARIELERAERERERLTKEKASLEQEREQKNVQLASLALHLVHKNEFLAEIRETLSQTAPENGDDLVRRINEHVRGDRDWQQFEEQMNAMQGDFLTHLSQRYPDLTTTERKIAALMRLNLSSKAVANLLCLSVRTVENHRLSVRRKLGLANDVNLTTFLGSL